MSTVETPSAVSLRELAEQSNAWPFEEARNIVTRLRKTPKGVFCWAAVSAKSDTLRSALKR